MSQAAIRGTPSSVGRFELVQRLAVGGMAEVFLAIERSAGGLERKVVIKQILPQHDADEVMKRMLLTEAKVAASIHHPNVVQIYELGQEDGRPYIAMEYVAGASLTELMQARAEKNVPIPVGAAVCLVMQALSGLHAAHELKDRQGRPVHLVHRDLSPHNLMVTKDGNLKILDFGIAKISDTSDRTKTGMLKGKFPYMSPEQVEGKPIDRRSDIFTLGAVLWELLAGERLFQRSNEVATINAVMSLPIPDLARPDVSPELNAVIKTALARKLEERFVTAHEMWLALDFVCKEVRLDVSLSTVARTVDRVFGDDLTERLRTVDEAVERSIGEFDRTFRRERARRVWLRSFLAAGVVFVGGMVGATFLWMTNQAKTLRAVPYGEPVVVALPRVVDADRLRSELEPLRIYLEDRIHRPIQWRVESYADAAALVVSGEAPFGHFPPYLYVKTTKEFGPLQLLAVKVYDGSSGSDAVLLVPEVSRYTSVDELRGKTICYSDLDSTTGYLLPRVYLRKAGIDPDVDLKAHISGDHLQALRDLTSGVCDVAGTYMGAYLAADAAGIPTGTTRVLAIVGRTPHDAVVAGAKTDPNLAAAMRDALLDFDPKRDAGVERLGEVERLTGFTIATEAIYADVRAAVLSEEAARQAQVEGPPPAP